MKYGISFHSCLHKPDVTSHHVDHRSRRGRPGLVVGLHDTLVSSSAGIIIPNRMQTPDVTCYMIGSDQSVLSIYNFPPELKRTFHMCGKFTCLRLQMAPVKTANTSSHSHLPNPPRSRQQSWDCERNKAWRAKHPSLLVSQAFRDKTQGQIWNMLNGKSQGTLTPPHPSYAYTTQLRGPKCDHGIFSGGFNSESRRSSNSLFHLNYPCTNELLDLLHHSRVLEVRLGSPWVLLQIRQHLQDVFQIIRSSGLSLHF